MKYNIGDKVRIAKCPNHLFNGMTGTITVARLNGTYNVNPDKKISDYFGTIFVYDTEIIPA